MDRYSYLDELEDILNIHKGKDLTMMSAKSIDEAHTELIKLMDELEVVCKKE